MNRTSSFRNNAWINFNWLLAALALALAPPARAGTPPAAIPLSDIGAKATAGYQGDALGVTVTADGARLRCGFQKLEGHATPEGLWLESTKPGAAGKLRLTASAICRDSSRARECALTEPDVLELFAPTDVGGYTALTTTGKVSVNDKRVWFIRPGLTEEYSVSVDGVRQDFIIESPPLNPQLLAASERSADGSTLNHSAGALRVELALSGARAEPTAGGVKLTFEGSGRTLAYSRLRAADATGRELTACLEVLSADRLAVRLADANATYPLRIDPTFSDAEWVGLGSGMGGINSVVDALTVSGTNLYAGGIFGTAGGVPAKYVAKWNGSAWSALGSGMNGKVNALAVSGTNLYAGGSFTAAGFVNASGIAKWNGSAWSALGSGMNGGYVYALAVIGTNLYAGGIFGTAGGVLANGIAKWDGNAWSALSSGVSGEYGIVCALAVSGTDLYVGGYFTTAGGMLVNSIAKWDGSAWSALGSGIGGYSGVYALALSGTDLYAGGSFNTAEGGTVNYIAKWDGSAWSALGSGIGSALGAPYVGALAVSGTNLYAGGDFPEAGGVTANYIAKWDGNAWSALGSGVNWIVEALAADGAGHLFVGGDFTVAGTNTALYIAQANLPRVPTILMPAQTQTAEAGAIAQLAVSATGEPPPVYQWYFNGTNLLSCANSDLVLTNLLVSQSGTYTVVATNGSGAVTSAPVLLNVIATVQRRPVPGVRLTGASGSLLNVDYANALNPMPAWNPLGSVSLTSPPQYCFDTSQPLPPQRFYRAWQTGTPGVRPSLNLSFVPAITLTGSIGGRLRVDCINQFGPTDAWVTLDTVTLTNTSQLYFDTSAPGQPERLYRLVPSP